MTLRIDRGNFLPTALRKLVFVTETPRVYHDAKTELLYII
jgi:hypothetical protein